MGWEYYSMLTKEPVPDDEDTAIVFVYTVGVPAMVHPVMAGRAQNPLQGAQLTHRLQETHKTI